MPRKGGRSSYAKAAVVRHLDEIFRLRRQCLSAVAIHKALGERDPEIAEMPYKTFYAHYIKRDEYSKEYGPSLEYRPPELMLCPFCNGQAKFEYEDGDGDFCTVKCTECGFSLKGYYLEKEMAALHWEEIATAVNRMADIMANERLPAREAEDEPEVPAAKPVAMKPRGMGR